MLYLRCGKYYKCDYKYCNKILTLSGYSKYNKCNGCKCVYYCNKLCQKRDWKLKHGEESISC